MGRQKRNFKSETIQEKLKQGLKWLNIGRGYKQQAQEGKLQQRPKALRNNKAEQKAVALIWTQTDQGPCERPIQVCIQLIY